MIIPKGVFTYKALNGKNIRNHRGSDSQQFGIYSPFWESDQRCQPSSFPLLCTKHMGPPYTLRLVLTPRLTSSCLTDEGNQVPKSRAKKISGIWWQNQSQNPDSLRPTISLRLPLPQFASTADKGGEEDIEKREAPDEWSQYHWKETVNTLDTDGGQDTTVDSQDMALLHSPPRPTQKRRTWH